MLFCCVFRRMRIVVQILAAQHVKESVYNFTWERWWNLIKCSSAALLQEPNTNLSLLLLTITLLHSPCLLLAFWYCLPKGLQISFGYGGILNDGLLVQPSVSVRSDPYVSLPTTFCDFYPPDDRSLFPGGKRRCPAFCFLFVTYVNKTFICRQILSFIFLVEYVFLRYRQYESQQ